MEIRHLYPANTIMKVTRPLYGILEARTHYLTDKTFSNHKETTLKEVTFTIKNLKRSLRFLPLNLKTIKLFVFVDRSFANNANLTSQLSFIVILANKESNNYTTTGNIVHFSSTKCKQVTWSVLASEIYAIVASADITHAIRTTLTLITKRLAIPLIPTVIYTNSYLLYECLVKLSTTKEKQLIIDIIALRQSYKRHEIHKIQWIHGSDNPADSFTKSSLNSALEALVSDGKVKIRMNR
ncbi:hypothetical protein LX36DRAFT_663751 [Colletotrichum falcatum]|nr:hypothetical protein LX36DRAFT_663751 [Colletotrichum falcatum]